LFIACSIVSSNGRLAVSLPDRATPASLESPDVGRVLIQTVESELRAETTRASRDAISLAARSPPCYGPPKVNTPTPMKTLLALLAALLALSLFALAADKDAKTPKARLRHVVSLKFKDNATKEQIKQVEDAFAALETRIPTISALKWGTNVSPEKLNKGFTHCFLLTFKSDKDRDTYLDHPAHKEFGKLLEPVLADVMVIDFWAKD
jgi:hypothetical protein